MQTAEGRLRKDGTAWVYEYNLKDHLGNIRVSFDKNPSTGLARLIQKDDYYPFGGTFNSPNVGENKYLYNGKELQQETGWYDYGARMYMPDLGRWGAIDPAADLLEMSSPFVYALNNPVNFIDLDGELPIFINGRVWSASERGSESYWDAQLLKTIRSSGIANPGGEEFYVDGDRYSTGLINWNDGMPRSATGTQFFGVDLSLGSGNSSALRHNAGYFEAKRDFDKILSMLERDPESDKIIEKIQIYSHSRGAAFASGYTEALLELISKNAEQFKDPSNVIDFVLHLAPHQSGSISAFSDNEYSIHHNDDWLSGNNMSGVKGAFSSKEGKGVIGAHSTSSFVNEVAGFLSTIAKSEKGSNKKAISQFIRVMRNYGIEVTIHE